MGIGYRSKKQFRMYAVLIVLTVFVYSASSEQCLHPAPAPNYSNELYAGTWYEVGKYQTLGGSIFQQGTVCTTATYAPWDMEQGGGDIGYSSRKTNPSGDYVNATGTLEALETPGHFNQQLVFFGFEGPEVNYNVVWLDEDSAIEYDCNPHLLGYIDYCVHFMSRTPTMAEEKLDELKAFVIERGLNTHSLEYQGGEGQNGCWEE